MFSHWRTAIECTNSSEQEPSVPAGHPVQQIAASERNACRTGEHRDMSELWPTDLFRHTCVQSCQTQWHHEMGDVYSPVFRCEEVLAVGQDHILDARLENN